MASTTELPVDEATVIPDEFKPLLSEVLGMGRRLADYPLLAEGAIIKQGIENAYQAVSRARWLLEKRIITDQIEAKEADIRALQREIETLKDQEKECGC